MSTAKTFEVRDRGTTMPVLAVRLDPANEAERWNHAHTGYGRTAAEQAQHVICLRLSGGEGKFNCDPQGWANDARTMPIAHQFIAANFDDLKTGAVIDVEFILGETPTAKVSEALGEHY